MSDQNKHTGTPASTTPNKETNTGTTVAQHPKDKREQGTSTAPEHEQGREHTPDVDAKKEAADTRRTSEQSHTPSTTGDKNAKASDGTTGRKETEVKHVATDNTAKAGHDPVKNTSSTNNSGTR